MNDKYTKNARNNAEATETDQGSDTDYMSVPAGTRKEADRGEGERAPPGPASSKARYKTRSRSGSVSSISSCTSSASAAVAAERRSRREVAHEANRLAMAMAKEQGGEQPSIYVDSNESDEESRSPERRKPPLKRKMEKVEDSGELFEETRRKQGRPQTTGLYVRRAEALEELNKKKREAAELDNEKIIKSMSTGQIFSKVETDLEEAVDGIENTPTTDVANQARECMAGVLKVAKCSKNLKGGFIKILRHAAVVGTVSAEVLRTRADSSESDNDAFRQLKAMRKELERVKREAQTAREEAERAKKEAEALRKELAEAEAHIKRGSRR